MRGLFVCDIDDTILPRGREISEATKKAVRLAMEHDYGFTLATGRSFYVVRKYADELGIQIPVITCNGASVYDYTQDAPIIEHPITAVILEELFSEFLANRCDFVAYCSHGIYFSKDSKRLDFFHRYNDGVCEEWKTPLLEITKVNMQEVIRDNRFTKILLCNPSEALAQKLLQDSRLKVVPSMADVLDIMPCGITKGNAIVSLANHFHVPLSDVYCFGDEENDISMFTCGCNGVAMGNASDYVKSFATRVTETCIEDGVAKEITRVISSLR
ncbi:MAG TPA: HAD family hydrolase [Bacillota bacterium]|nr:HAD family hydrolase [Bacillota bacterium]HPE38383.1 HAD family hydrolase [Bacillota bacterium]